jgi:hypothetical protein
MKLSLYLADLSLRAHPRPRFHRALHLRTRKGTHVGDLIFRTFVILKRHATHACTSPPRPQDQREFAKIAESFKSSFNDGPRVQWGGHILGECLLT